MKFNFDGWDIVGNGRTGRACAGNEDKVRIVQNKNNNVVFYFYKPVQTVLSLAKGGRYQLALRPEMGLVALLKKDFGNLLAQSGATRSGTLHVSFTKKCFFGDCVEVPLKDIEADEDGNIVFYLSGKPTERPKPVDPTDQKLAKIKARESATLEVIIDVLKDRKGGAPEAFIKTETIRLLKKRGGEVVGAIYVQELLDGNVGTLFNVAEFGKNNRYYSLKG